jgi:hypothetical protein
MVPAHVDPRGKLGAVYCPASHVYLDREARVILSLALTLDIAYSDFKSRSKWHVGFELGGKGAGILMLGNVVKVLANK